MSVETGLGGGIPDEHRKYGCFLGILTKAGAESALVRVDGYCAVLSGSLDAARLSFSIYILRKEHAGVVAVEQGREGDRLRGNLHLPRAVQRVAENPRLPAAPEAPKQLTDSRVSFGVLYTFIGVQLATDGRHLLTQQLLNLVGDFEFARPVTVCFRFEVHGNPSV
jgi:hypothetical protein